MADLIAELMAELIAKLITMGLVAVSTTEAIANEARK